MIRLLSGLILLFCSTLSMSVATAAARAPSQKEWSFGAEIGTTFAATAEKSMGGVNSLMLGAGSHASNFTVFGDYAWHLQKMNAVYPYVAPGLGFEFESKTRKHSARVVVLARMSVGAEYPVKSGSTDLKFYGHITPQFGTYGDAYIGGTLGIRLFF